MAVAHEVAQQAHVVRQGLGALAVGDACGLTDRSFVAHVVDHTDEAMVQYGRGHAEDRVKGFVVRAVEDFPLALYGRVGHCQGFLFLVP